MFLHDGCVHQQVAFLRIGNEQYRESVNTFYIKNNEEPSSVFSLFGSEGGSVKWGLGVVADRESVFHSLCDGFIEIRWGENET